MNNIIHLSKIALLGIFALATPRVFAQGAQQATTTGQISIHIERDENGNKEVIDKTFGSKEEADAFMRDNKLEAVEPGAGPVKIVSTPLPPFPDPPAPKDPNGPTGKGPADNGGRKIMITENGQGGTATQLQITANGLTAEERATIIQQLLDMKAKGVSVQMIEAKKMTINKQVTETIEHGMADDVPGNLSAVRVYPNPNNGQFHVEFNIEKPVNVTLRIMDIQGKELYANTLNNYSGNFKQDISRSDLSHGTYIMHIQAGSEQRATQVVLQ